MSPFSFRHAHRQTLSSYCYEMIIENERQKEREREMVCVCVRNEFISDSVFQRLITARRLFVILDHLVFQSGKENLFSTIDISLEKIFLMSSRTFH